MDGTGLEMGPIDRVSVPLENVPTNTTEELPSTSNVSYPLHHAVCVGATLSEVDKLIVESPEALNDKDCYGYWPIHYAAKYGHYTLLDHLLQKEAVPEKTTENERFTVLHILALQTNHTTNKLDEISEESLKKISKCLKEVDSIGCNPLHQVCRSGNNSLFDILCKHCDLKVIIGCLEEINNIHESPLHEICRSGEETLIKKIINVYKEYEDTFNDHIEMETGPVNTAPHEAFFVALIEMKTNHVKKAPFHVACRGIKVEIVEMLLKLLNEVQLYQLINLKDRSDRTPLHYASELEDKTIITLLIEKRPEICKDSAGKNPLHIAARFGREDVAKALLSYNKDQLNDEDKFYETPLFHAARYKKYDFVKYLLREGAEPKKVNKEHHTPFLCAAIRGYTKVCKKLKEKGSSWKDTDSNGKNFVHLAAERNHAEFLKDMLASDQDYQEILNSTDNNSNTPLHLAAEKGHSACVAVLLNNSFVKKEAKNKDRWTAMHFAAANGHTKVMEYLLQESCRFLAEDSQGNTPFHLCCMKGHCEATKLLLLYQIGFDIRNGKNRTPLDVAAEEGHEGIVKLLFEAISEISPEKLTDLVNPKDGNIPLLHLAISNGRLAVVEFLLESKKVELNIYHPKSKLSPIQSAIKLKHESIAMALINCEAWTDALNCEWVHKAGTTPFKELIKEMPLVALHVLNQCTNVKELSSQNGDTNGEFTISFDFDYVEDGKKTPSGSNNKAPSNSNNAQSELKKYCDCDQWSIRGSKRNHPLQIMVHKKQKMLLDHPLTVALLNFKWKTFGIYGYGLGLLFYFVFLSLLTSFALRSPNPQESTCLANFSINNMEDYL